MGMGSNKEISELEIQNKASGYYEDIRYSRLYSKKYQRWWTDKMLSFIKEENLKGKVLDNGCGIGSHYEALSKHSRDITGIDISEQMIYKARPRVQKVILGDSQHLPFKNGNFDLVFSRSLLHHLPNPEVSVSEISRVLKESGEAVFSDTNCSILSKLPRKIAKEKGEHFSDSHKNFRVKELLDIISSELHVDKLYYFGYIAYPLLGFPDIIDVFKFAPFKNFTLKILIKIDEFISMLPAIRTQSWGVMIKASKKRKV